MLSVNINDKYSSKYVSSLKKCNSKEVVMFCMTIALYTLLISGCGEHWSFTTDRHSHTQRTVVAVRKETRKLREQNCIFSDFFALYQLQTLGASGL